MGIADILNSITVSQLLLLAAFLLLNWKKRKSNKFLALLFIVESFVIIDILIWRYLPWSLENIAQVIFLPHMFSKMWGASLLFYVMSMTSSSFIFRKRDLLHAIPMLSYGVFIFFSYYLYPSFIRKDMLLQGLVVTRTDMIVITLLTQIINISYIIFSIVRLKRYSAGLKKFYSSTDKKSLTWLWFVVVGFLIFWVAATVHYSMFLIFGTNIAVINLADPIIYMLSCVITINGLKTPELFIADENRKKYQKYPMNDARKKEYMERLDAVMKSGKPHFEPELTLSGLSEKTMIPERYLSQIINDVMGRNFYDYVNEFRIKEAMRLLEKNDSDMNVLEILLESGFNSKSAFNAVFRKVTGMSPSEYKRKH
jgi:AraC-like DNA-binding protein